MFPYFLFACIMIITLSSKHNYHVDEIYTYALANHITDIGMDIQLAPHTYSPAPTAYTDYMAAQAPFDLSHIWSNQANDVHPPLYYCMIYLISFLFKGSASKWIAGSINIIFMLLVLWISRKLLRVLEFPDTGLQPDLQIVVVNRYLGSVDETANFYVDTNGTYVRKY